MSPAEQPELDPETPHYVPERGTFSVMTLDPVASVAHLDDAQATAAAAALVSKGYVIYLVGVRPLFSPRAAFREETPYFVQRGIPRDLPAQHVDASIHPNAHHSRWRRTRSRGRTATTTVRSPNVRAVDRVVCALDRAARFRVIEAFNEDRDARHDRLAARRERERAAGAGHGDAGDEKEADAGLQEQAPVDEAEAGAIFRALIADDAEERLPVAHFTYDLARVGAVHDVCEYRAEAERIAAIVAASLARKKAAIAEGDAARYDTRTAELLHGHRARAAGRRVRRIITRSTALVRRILCIS
ncbi:hypothetical protein MIND_00549900 [Mycena indigotica]|uniref:Uncharacterized protein n=1 Tax=Mycena indigotica TaxID=2126181 RepID=A0A8H6SY32_9AGAR|nr:uncharacterized protein MIND_00549900 [Mycena indigotica]KAF7307551.1 hypothetical protein MIND_00549900 [Mycena indigotica]